LSVKVYNLPAGEPRANIDLSVNGKSLYASVCYVSAVPFNRRWPGHQRSEDQREEAYFARLSADEPVKFTYRPKKAFSECVVRPLSKKIEPAVYGGEITFTIPSCGGYTVELDGTHNALHIFIDAPVNYAVSKENCSYYYGPGVHSPGLITLNSGETVYIDEGAVVFGSIAAKDASNIKILGRGILDNSHNREEILFSASGDGSTDTQNSRRSNTIELRSCKNIFVEGITVRNSLLYNFAVHDCEDGVIENVKTIGCWRYNSDGIDLHNCERFRVSDCFLRTYDDSLCAKGNRGAREVCRDITFERCTVWSDWGMALEIGADTCADRMYNIVFRDCDIIHLVDNALDVQNVDYGDVYEVLFEDIRVEYGKDIQQPRIQKNDEEIYSYKEDSDYLPRLMMIRIYKHHEYSTSCPDGRNVRGQAHDILFKNISVFSESGNMPKSLFKGFDEEHRVRNIAIDGLFLNGFRIQNKAHANLEIRDFCDDIILR